MKFDYFEAHIIRSVNDIGCFHFENNFHMTCDHLGLGGAISNTRLSLSKCITQNQNSDYVNNGWELLHISITLYSSRYYLTKLSTLDCIQSPGLNISCAKIVLVVINHDLKKKFGNISLYSLKIQ